MISDVSFHSNLIGALKVVFRVSSYRAFKSEFFLLFLMIAYKKLFKMSFSRHF